MGLYIKVLLPLMAISIASLVKSEVKNYEILERTQYAISVKINPMGFIPKTFYKRNNSSDIYCNTNYYWNNYPVGWIKNTDVLDSWYNTLSTERPVLVFDILNKPSIINIKSSLELQKYPVASQAGPWLVRDGLVVYPGSFKVENFMHDIARPTAHVAVGVTAYNKVVIVYSQWTTLSSLSQRMVKWGCRWAMNCDGGSSAGVKVDRYRYGNKNPKYGVEFFKR